MYIQAGRELPAEEALEAPWPRESTHRFALTRDARAARDFAGGRFRLATVNEWPISQDMAGGLLTIRPGELLPLHWHPNANEWNYCLRGTAAVSLFGAEGRHGTTMLRPGDAAYYPQGYGHAIRNVGADEVELLQTWDAGRFEEITLKGLLHAAPRRLLAANLAGVPAATLAALAGP